ncbi:apolipoprotein N-acyltransferase [Primorskyibacter sp. 2E233]|uniref:apolipoprotein N-acyltransferase n=1 Tax=Primorskyibacter sp. 2E233 TaxID=3413431 RepID=UPI003BF2209F
MTDGAPSLSRPFPRWARLPLAVGFGMLMGLGAAPFDLWPIALVGCVGAFWLFLNTPKGILAAGTGWAVGFGYFGLSLGWIVEPFLVDAASTGWMAPFGLLGLAGGLALFWALAFWGAGQSRRHPLAALVVTWSAAELARAYVLTGFPWGLVGYVWAPSPGIQWVSVIGPHGLTILTLAWAAFSAKAICTPSAIRAITVALVLAAILGGGWLLTPPQQDLSGRPIVRLIQPNAAQHEKWNPAMVPVFFDRQVTYTAAPTQIPDSPRPALIVWPETSVPVLLHRAGETLAMISDAAQGSPVALGIQRAESGNYFNSLAVLDGYGDVAQVYDKHHLVPFGEYMPAAELFKRWNIAGLAARAEGGYAAGPGPQLINLGPLGLALPLICYEAVFPQDVQRAPVRPDMLLQITNDAWFGQWSGPYQHLAQARIRAIEQGLPLLRAANTGVSAVIDGGGRIIASLPLGEAGFIDAPLPLPLRLTIYARTGDLSALLVLFVSTLGLIRFKSNKAH